MADIQSAVDEMLQDFEFSPVPDELVRKIYPYVYIPVQLFTIPKYTHTHTHSPLAILLKASILV